MTSRKLIICLLASMVMRNPLLLKRRHISFLMFSVSLGVALVIATVSVTNVVTQNHIWPLTPFNVEVTFMFMDWSAKDNRQKQH